MNNLMGMCIDHCHIIVTCTHICHFRGSGACTCVCVCQTLPNQLLLNVDRTHPPLA